MSQPAVSTRALLLNASKPALFAWYKLSPSKSGHPSPVTHETLMIVPAFRGLHCPIQDRMRTVHDALEICAIRLVNQLDRELPETRWGPKC